MTQFNTFEQKQFEEYIHLLEKRISELETSIRLFKTGYYGPFVTENELLDKHGRLCCYLKQLQDILKERTNERTSKLDPHT